MRFTVWRHSPDRIGNWQCWFLRRGENRSTRRKTSRSKDENRQQTQPTYDVESEIELGPHWWEASALTTAPSLLLYKLLQNSFPAIHQAMFILDYKQRTVNSLYCGHPRNRELVYLIARVRNSRNLFQSNVCNLILPGI